MHLSVVLYWVCQCGNCHFLGVKCGQEEYFLTSPEMNTFGTNTIFRV